MSHNIEYGVYKENVNKKKVQTDWDNFVCVADREEGASGLPGAIRWNDGVTPLDSKSDAERWIDEHDGGWYDQIAVRFYDVDHVKSGKVDVIRKKLSEANDKFRARNSILVKDVRTSEFIGCTTCGSKLKRTYLKTNQCPLCRADLRSATELKAINGLLKKSDTLQKQLKDEIAKQRKKAEIKWLVKIEYHT